MNNKLIISTVLAAVLPVSSAFAAGISQSSAGITDDGKGFVVSGKLDSVGSSVDEVIIKVMDVGDTDETPSAEVKAISVIDMYEKSEFSETLKVEDELASGRYYVYFTGTGLTEPSEPIEIWYQAATDKQTLINDIYSASNGEAGASLSGFETVLFGDAAEYVDGKMYDRADKLGLKNSLYKNAYDADVSKILYNNKTQDYDTLKSNFNIAAAIAAFEAGEFGAWVGSDKVMTTKIWSDDDTTMGNAQKHFNETLSAQGRQNVISLVSGKEYATVAEFNKAFSRAVIYNGVYYPNSSLIGYGHYYNLISELALASEHDFSAYTSLDENSRESVGSQLLQANAGDFDKMTAALSTIISGLGGTTPENTNTGGGGNGGGNAVMSGNTGAYIPGVAQTPTQTAGFNDLDSVEWAKEAILYLKEKNIVSGTGDGAFEPNRAVKREEFIKMLIAALEIETGEAGESFTDVDASAWYAPYISAALNLNITSGMGDGSFGIGKPITREQCCAFIYRACSDRDFSGEEKTFNDSDKVSDYAKESVKALSSAGIIVGDENGSFNPLDNVTRAQTAVMIYRLISGGKA